MAKIKFKDPVNRENLIKVKSPVGSHFEDIIKWRVDEAGRLVRKVVKTENIYDRIQADRDSVDLEKILERYENGDATALDKVQGMYLNTAEMPKTIHELYQAMAVHDDVFNSMPVDVKKMFHNSASEFWSEFGTEEFDGKLNSYRAEVYGKQLLTDPEPINTANVNVVEKEVIDNVEKPE